MIRHTPKKTWRCTRKNQFSLSQSFILRRIRRKVLLHVKCGDGFAAKTYNIPLIILSSFNMYFINLFPPTLTATDVDLIQCVSNRTCLSSARQLRLWCLLHKGERHWQSSEMEVTSVMFGIILPGDNLSLAYPSQCTQDRALWCLRRFVQRKRDSWRRNKSSKDSQHSLLPEDLDDAHSSR